MRFQLRLLLVGGLILSAVAAGDEEHPAKPEVWLCPPGDTVFQLADPSADWPYAKEHLTGLKVYTGTLRKGAPEDLARLAALVRDQEFQFAVECGGTLNHDWEDQAGEMSAQVELASLAHWYDAGGKVDYLDMDGPVRRLLGYSGWGKDPAKKFVSIERCAAELMDYMAAVKQAHPEIRFWLLTNFPNWGYRGEVSYHARGPNRQDWGDYHEVVSAVLEAAKASGMSLAGATVDNPYEYAVGKHFSVNLEDPAQVDWVARIRTYEDYCKARGLEFNLIINSEEGGKTSDEMFFTRTLEMLDLYRSAGGTPTRYMVQSWYEYPKSIVPESDPDSLTALAKAVIARLEESALTPSAVRRSYDPAQETTEGLQRAYPPRSRNAAVRISLTPRQGYMTCVASVPALDGQSFSLGIPETIGARSGVLLNFPEADGKLHWEAPQEDGSVACEWTTDGRIRYAARLVPVVDHVDLEMTVENLSPDTWRDVFWFNCVNPTGAPDFKDWTLERTYMSSRGAPMRMDKAERVIGPRQPTLQFFLHEQTPWGMESHFPRGFGATSPVRTDGNWIVTQSESGDAYMAATSQDALFLFDNLDRCCIHSAPCLGDIGPGETSKAVCRLYFAQGSLRQFFNRQASDATALAERQAWARPPRPRIELAAVPAPAQDRRTGTLGLQIRAPWMTSPIVLRFPETAHSSLGLHFIDHERRDMPPLSWIDPFPAWEQDASSGILRYECDTGTGIALRAEAVPYEEEVFLRFTMTNTTDAPIQRGYAQMCLSMGGSAEFGKTDDVSDVFALFDGKFASLATATPTAEEKGRAPWLIIGCEGSGVHRGPMENRDGWWVVDQLADVPLIARLSEDHQHLVAIQWEGAQGIMTNSRIPCLHGGPRQVGEIAPGKSHTWYGKIYLMENDLEVLRFRYRGDTGEWLYPEITQLLRQQLERGNRR